MNSRPVAASFFVVFCLLLCGLILRRQIAAHPLPPDTGQQGSAGRGLWADDNWRPAPPLQAKLVQDAVRAEIAALGSGNMPKAMLYGSLTRRQRFSNPAQYRELMQERNPALLAHLPFQFGPIGINLSKRNAWAVVVLKNPSGGRTRADFLLVREGELFKIDRIRSEPL